MLRRRLGALTATLTATLTAALAGLAGCDDGAVLSRMDNIVGRVSAFVIPMAAGGLPVEVHGAPFEGVTAAMVVGRLRLPPAYPSGLGLRAVSPGEAGGRLVLAFNPAVPGRAAAACAGRPGVTAPNAAAVGFSVTATLCDGARVLSSGHLDARKTRADDPAGFTRAMDMFFLALLGDR